MKVWKSQQDTRTYNPFACVESRRGGKQSYYKVFLVSNSNDETAINQAIFNLGNGRAASKKQTYPTGFYYCDSIEDFLPRFK